MQFWPESSYWSAAFCAAASRSASAKTSSGPLPPSSAVKGTRFCAAAVATSRPVSEDPVKLTRRRRGSSYERGPGLLADSLDDVEDAGRDLRLRGQVGEERAGERCPLGRLEDDRAARRERRRRLPGGEHERRIPRRDHANRAGRHAGDAVRGVVRAPRALLVGLGEVGVGAVVPRAARDHAGAQRALEHRHVEALDGGDPLDVLVDQLGEAAQALGPRGDAARRPRGERVGGRLDGEADLVIAPAGDFGEHLLVDRGAVLEALVARDALPADEVVGRDRDSRDDGAGHGVNTVALGSTTVLPPSMATTAPVMNPASSDASQATAAAISSGLPGRRNGTGEATSP